eukprot:6181266-Pleurochrysis_carterae.AAC.2
MSGSAWASLRKQLAAPFGGSDLSFTLGVGRDSNSVIVADVAAEGVSAVASCKEASVRAPCVVVPVRSHAARRLEQPARDEWRVHVGVEAESAAPAAACTAGAGRGSHEKQRLLVERRRCGGGRGGGGLPVVGVAKGAACLPVGDAQSRDHLQRQRRQARHFVRESS